MTFEKDHLRLNNRPTPQPPAPAGGQQSAALQQQIMKLNKWREQVGIGNRPTPPRTIADMPMVAPNSPQRPPTQTPVQQPPSGTPHPRRPAVKPHAGGYQRAGNYPPPPTGQPPDFEKDHLRLNSRPEEFNQQQPGQPGQPGSPGFGDLLRQNQGLRETYGDTTRPTFEYPEGPPRRADGTLHPHQAEIDERWRALMDKHKQDQEEEHQSNVAQFGEGYMDNEEWWKTKDTPHGRHGQYSAYRKRGLSHEDALSYLRGGGPANPPPPREVDPSKWSTPWIGSPQEVPGSTGLAGAMPPRQPTAPAGTSSPSVVTSLPGTIGNTPVSSSLAGILHNAGKKKRTQAGAAPTGGSNFYNEYKAKTRSSGNALGYQPIRGGPTVTR